MAAPLLLVILMSPFLTGSVGARVHRWPGMQYLHNSSTPRVVFVTSIFGTYEKTLKEPVRQTVPAHFLAFTDREDLNSSGWQVRRLPDIVQTFQALVSQDENIGPNKLTEDSSTFMKAKIIKTQMHRFLDFDAYDVVVWLDATVSIVNPKTADYMLQLVAAGRNFITFEHELSRHGHVSAEVQASLFYRYTTTSKIYGPAQDIAGQYARYLDDGFKEKWWLHEYDAPMGIKDRPQYGLWVTCFVAYATKSPDTASFLNSWWTELVQQSTQDQVSFPYVAWKQKVYPFSLPTNVSGVVINGDADNNDLYKKLPHGNRRM